jgi:hypothetical protein
VYVCHIDWVTDTSDTSTRSDWSDDVTVDVEYEVASLPEKETPLGDGSLSSDTDVSFTYFQKQLMWLLIADC